MNVIQIVHQALLVAVDQIFSPDAAILKNINVSLNTDASKQQFGDLSSNCALILAKEVKKAPLQVAQAIKEKFKHDFVDHVEVAGPGFINIFLTDEAFKELALQLTLLGDSFFRLDVHLPRLGYSIEFVS